MADRIDELLDQLRAISPLSEDDFLSEEELETYCIITDELAQYTDNRVIQPPIQSFGYGLGYEAYGVVVRQLEQYAPDLIFPYLVDAVQHGERGSRMWATRMLGRQENSRAIPYLRPLLEDPEVFVRVEAVHALGRLDDQASRPILEQMQADPSADVRSVVRIAFRYLNAGMSGTQ